jgi:AcrR family transcriptional regulator
MAAMNIKRQRLDPATRRTSILEAAGRVALRGGLPSVTLNATAIEAQCARGLVTHYFSTIGALVAEMIREAIKHGNAKIVADALAARHEAVKDAPDKLLRQAKRILLG